ncbi:MAG: Zinc carboxypeptidase, partial [Bryobacterales bacterium]|nr:Zinc carboxypeptidase [Bryobacterales bacterium]
MPVKSSSLLCGVAVAFTLLSSGLEAQALNNEPQGPDPNQAVEGWYTQQIAKYTTAPEFNSPLTNYLPASPNVPTPAK